MFNSEMPSDVWWLIPFSCLLEVWPRNISPPESQKPWVPMAMNFVVTRFLTVSGIALFLTAPVVACIQLFAFNGMIWKGNIYYGNMESYLRAFMWHFQESYRNSLLSQGSDSH